MTSILGVATVSCIRRLSSTTGTVILLLCVTVSSSSVVAFACAPPLPLNEKRVERVLSVVLTGITILLRVPSLPCERLRARGRAVPKHEKQMP